jgi:glycosyltransferase involved in cell wall biosynthesis
MTTDQQLFISVIVPTWNRCDYLRDTLQSVVDQDWTADRYEVLVVDDGSTDQTAEIVREFQERNGHAIRYIRKAHAGLNAGRNAGILAARGDIVLFLDDDELAEPDHLSRLVAAFGSDAGLSGVGGPARDYGGSTVRTCATCTLAASDLPGEGVRAVPTLLGGNMAFRRRVFDEVGLFDPELSLRGDETEWFRRANGLRFLYDPDLWIRHRRDRMTLWTLCRSGYRGGLSLAVYDRKVGTRQRPGPGRIVRYLGHAVRRRCARGLVLAFRQAGREVGHLRHRRSSRRAERVRTGSIEGKR